jgi:hypothetical protein
MDERWFYGKSQGEQNLFLAKNLCRTHIESLFLNNVEEHCELVPTSLENDATPIDPILDEVVVLSNDEVVVALNTNEHEPSYEDDGNAQIN